jgi:hypothetical protein
VGTAAAVSSTDRGKNALNTLIHSAAGQWFGAFPIVGDATLWMLHKFVDEPLNQFLAGDSKDPTTNFYGDPLALPMAKSVSHMFDDISKWHKDGEFDWDNTPHDVLDSMSALPYSPTRPISTGAAWLQRYFSGDLNFNDAEMRTEAIKDIISPIRKRPAK